MQIKQKWGRLRFVLEPATERQQAMIDLAEALSARLCESCGKPGQMASIRGYRTPRCAQHAQPTP